VGGGLLGLGGLGEELLTKLVVLLVPFCCGVALAVRMAKSRS
jgi:hypothetical protein